MGGKVIRFGWISIAIVLAAMVGCRPRETVTLGPEFLYLVSPKDVVHLPDFRFFSGEQELPRICKTIEQMKPEDVIVAINGVPLTKQDYDKLMGFKLKGLLRRKDMSQLVAQETWEQHRRTYVRRFIAQRLLVDNAFATGTITTNALLETISAKIANDARRRGQTIAKYISTFGEEWRYFVYERCIDEAVAQLVKAHIPPIAEVESNFVAAVQAQVMADNQAANATNSARRAILEDWRQKIVSGKATFDEAMKACAELGASECGVWGEFEDGDIDDERINSVAFATETGGITPVLDSEDAVRLIMVITAREAKHDADGTITNPATRTLAQIAFAKVPLMIEQGSVALTMDLKDQMQLQAINLYVTTLVTNGMNHVVYPHGSKLFD